MKKFLILVFLIYIWRLIWKKPVGPPFVTHSSTNKNTNILDAEFVEFWFPKEKKDDCIVESVGVNLKDRFIDPGKPIKDVKRKEKPYIDWCGGFDHNGVKK